MLKLVGTDGKRYYSWVLTPGLHVVGRRPECEIPIPHSTVSRNHAQIDVSSESGNCLLTDLGSHNGTVVNGARISTPIPIKRGDRILFGQTEFKLTAADEASGIAGGITYTRLSTQDPRNSVFVSINEALKPLPAKVIDRPELLPTLFEMAKILVLPEPKDVMLERSLGLIARVIPADRLAVLFVADDSDQVYTAACLLPGGHDPGEFTLSHTIVHDIMANKNAILIRDPQADPRFAEQKSIILSALKSAVAVPLFDEGKVLGILYADTTRPAQQYDDDHLRVLATFGNIIASKLLSYALYTERQEKQIMDAELRRASQIQKTLLVTALPEFPGYQVCACQEQSRSVGGDLYDLTVLPDGRLLFLVADVSGKGMGAALLMSNILASFRILYEQQAFDLPHVVERVSVQMHRSSAPGDFATVFLGVLDREAGRVRFVNAGHNPPLVIRANGELERLESSGVMIGAFDFAAWAQGETTLSPDDLLFIFTDGVTEAMRGEEQYGDDRMEHLVIDARAGTPEEIVERLMADVNTFMGDAPRSDDITILILKRVAT